MGEMDIRFFGWGGGGGGGGQYCRVTIGVD